MNARTRKILDLFESILGTDAEGDLEQILRDFVKGTPAEQAAAAAIASNLAATVEEVKLGQRTKTDLEFALAQARNGMIALAEAKVIRVKRKALEIFFDAITVFLRRVL